MRRFAGKLRPTALTVTLIAILLVAPSAGAATGDISEHPLPTPGASPEGLTVGPDGALWFTERNAGRIGRITPSGQVTEFPLPSDEAWPTGITAGPDGALWFTQKNANAIGRISPSGEITEFPLPSDEAWPTGITAGPDGALWFTEETGNRIGRITVSGEIHEYEVPTAWSWPHGITPGPDGALWFTERLAGKIGRITTDGQISEFPLTGGPWPTGIAAGPDGNLWFTEQAGNRIGRITTDGAVTEFDVPTLSSNPTGITAGPDGAMWFTEQAGNRIGHITTDGAIEEHDVPTSGSGPHGIATGPDGDVWFTQSAVSKVGEFQLAATDTEPPTITLTTPPDGAVYLVGQVVQADYTCDDADGSGVIDCAGTVADGATLDLNAAGIRHFTVRATDASDNWTEITHDYLVVERWGGRLVLPPAVASLRAGQPADLWFDLGADLGDGILDPGYPMSQEVECATGMPTGSLEAAEASGPGFRYAGGRYSFRWRTDRAWAGTCRQLALPFAIDGGVTLHLTAAFS